MADVVGYRAKTTPLITPIRVTASIIVPAITLGSVEIRGLIFYFNQNFM